MTKTHRPTRLFSALSVTGVMLGAAAIPSEGGHRFFPFNRHSGNCQTETCQTAGACSTDNPCGKCQGCGHGGAVHGKLFGWLHRPSNAVPEVLPLGSLVRAHDQVMETNAEAADFIMHRLNFVGQTAELTPDGKDRVLEIAARMRSAPFPVLVEREPNNADPELDALRRNLIAQILTDLGNPDAQQRTIVSNAYGPGYWSAPAQSTYWQYIGNFGNNNNFGNNGGNFGGGGGGGGGFF